MTTGETLALRCGRWCNCSGEWGERGARLRELSGGESGGVRHRRSRSRSRSRSLSLSLSLLLLEVWLLSLLLEDEVELLSPPLLLANLVGREEDEWLVACSSWNMGNKSKSKFETRTGCAAQAHYKCISRNRGTEIYVPPNHNKLQHLSHRSGQLRNYILHTTYYILQTEYWILATTYPTNCRH